MIGSLLGQGEGSVVPAGCGGAELLAGQQGDVILGVVAAARQEPVLGAIMYSIYTVQVSVPSSDLGVPRPPRLHAGGQQAGGGGGGEEHLRGVQELGGAAIGTVAAPGDQDCCRGRSFTILSADCDSPSSDQARATRQSRGRCFIVTTSRVQ